MLYQSSGSPAEFKFQRASDDFVQVQTKYSFSYVLPVPVTSMALSLNKQILVLFFLLLLVDQIILLGDRSSYVHVSDLSRAVSRSRQRSW